MATVVYTTVTRARLVRHSVGSGYSTDETFNFGPSSTIDFYGYFGGPPGDTVSHLYIVEMDGFAFPGTGYIPAGTITDVRPWVSAYSPGDPQAAWGGGTTGFTPEPTLDPFLAMVSTDTLVLEDFGTTYPPPSMTVCAAPDDLGVSGGAWADDLHDVRSGPSFTHLIVTAFGYQFTIADEVVTGGIPPRRIFGRTDGKTHGAPRLFGNR